MDCLAGSIGPISSRARGLFAVALLSLLAPGLAAQSTSLTIYGDGRVLQRRMLPLAVPSGESTLRVALGELDPGSLFPLDSGVVIAGVTYDAAVDEANTLRRAVGRRLMFVTGGRNGPDTVAAQVMGVDPERYRLADGQITFMRPGVPLFPADLVLAEPSVELALRSDRARRGFGVGFFSSGASWSADYTVMLGRGAAARVSGRAVIQAGRVRADSAEVQLLAGNVGRAGGPSVAAAPMVLRAEVAQGAASQQSVGEAHLYTVPGRVSLSPGLAVGVPLFDPASATIDRRYVVSGRLPYRGPVPQLGDEADVPVGVTYIVRRSDRAAFGRLPIPAGTVRVYRPDDAGRPQLIAEASVGHTAAGQDLVLDAGTAFDLTARRTQTDYSTRRDSLRTQTFATYAVTVANAGDSTVVVDVLERRTGEWQVLSSSLPGEKLSSTTMRFRVRVPAGGDATLTYRIRAVW